MSESDRYLNAEVSCSSCGYQWHAVFPEDTLQLQCPLCLRYSNAPGQVDPPLHIVSRIGNSTYIKPNRPVSRLLALGLLADVLSMLQNSTSASLDPKDACLNVIISSFHQDSG